MKKMLIILAIFSLIACNNKKENNMDAEFKTYLDKLETQLSMAYNKSTEAYFKASISGKDEDWKLSSAKEMEMNALMSDAKTFKELKKYKESNQIKNDTLKRALAVLYNNYLSKQIDTNILNDMSKMGADVEKKFSNFRANINGKKITDNEIEDILKREKDSKKLEYAWKAHKEVGNVVASDIISLVKKRNEAARKLGFKNFHEMNITLSEQNPDELLKFFDELDNLTRDAFKNVKIEIDNKLSKECNIPVDQMMPWHYQNRYFQEAPKIYDLDLDTYYHDKNILNLTETYYKNLGHPIDDMVKKSDLFEKPGKNQHAYCIDIDRNKNDIRVVANITPTNKWMETMLHEYGHALYQKYMNQQLPWILKQPAHTFATEGIAMLFGRFATNSEWMKDNLSLSNEEANKISVDCHKTMRLQQLVFSRWVQVVYRFEKEMYSNPDQDLNKLWWDLVEKYQMMKRPEGRNSPDWATKIHIATFPCYYHNYLLGEIFASQFYTYINEKILKNSAGSDQSWNNKKEAAKFLEENVYKVGNLYFWDDMIKKATGEKLTPKYYAKQFVN
jgi:peptidyl-dipeptidase A